MTATLFIDVLSGKIPFSFFKSTVDAAPISRMSWRAVRFDPPTHGGAADQIMVVLDVLETMSASPHVTEKVRTELGSRRLTGGMRLSCWRRKYALIVLVTMSSNLACRSAQLRLAGMGDSDRRGGRNRC